MLRPRTTTLRHVAAGGLVVALAVVGLEVGTAGAEEGTAGPSTAIPRSVMDPTGPQPLPISAVQSDQYRALRILRRPRRAADVVPAEAMAAAGPGRFGRNPALARAFSSPAGRGWVVPGDGVVCLVIQDATDGYGTTCAPTSSVATRGLTLGMISISSATATTLAPDGAVVTAQATDGGERSVEPDESGLLTVDADETAALDVATAAGHARTEVYDFADVQRGAVR